MVCQQIFAGQGMPFISRSPDIWKETYSFRAAACIRSLIRDGKLQHGQPVREALLLLAHQGLVSFESQKGKYVRSMSVGENLGSYAVSAPLRERSCRSPFR